MEEVMASNEPWYFVPVFYLTFGIGAALCGYLAYLLWSVTPENLPRREAWTRSRVRGLVLGYVVLVSCVPYAQVVAPNFLLPLLWPLAIVMPPVCACYVDYPNARAVSGSLILLAYLVVHYGFDMELPGAPALTVLAWVVGIYGIVLSAQPWRLRDEFRAGRRRRRVEAGFLALFALILLGEAIWNVFR